MELETPALRPTPGDISTLGSSYPFSPAPGGPDHTLLSGANPAVAFAERHGTSLVILSLLNLIPAGEIACHRTCCERSSSCRPPGSNSTCTRAGPCGLLSGWVPCIRFVEARCVRMRRARKGESHRLVLSLIRLRSPGLVNVKNVPLH